MELNDKAELLTLKCEKLQALIWLFSETYTACRLDEIAQTISANPGAFATTFSIIEDVICDIQDIANQISDMTA